MSNKRKISRTGITLNAMMNLVVFSALITFMAAAVFSALSLGWAPLLILGYMPMLIIPAVWNTYALGSALLGSRRGKNNDGASKGPELLMAVYLSIVVGSTLISIFVPAVTELASAVLLGLGLGPIGIAGSLGVLAGCTMFHSMFIYFKGRHDSSNLEGGPGLDVHYSLTPQPVAVAENASTTSLVPVNALNEAVNSTGKALLALTEVGDSVDAAEKGNNFGATLAPSC